MKDFWVTENGSYGTCDTRDMIMVDTYEWSESDWHDFYLAPDDYRLERAIEISDNRGEGGYEYA